MTYRPLPLMLPSSGLLAEMPSIMIWSGETPTETAGAPLNFNGADSYKTASRNTASTENIYSILTFVNCFL